MLEKTQEKHISVLLHELVDTISLSPSKKDIVIDCTLGF
jgi:16S rRNA C1402 N4-methylase RsmH